jgi:hypothetical protein
MDFRLMPKRTCTSRRQRHEDCFEQQGYGRIHENLQEAAFALAAEKASNENGVTIADAVAIGGAEAIESIGGPVLTVQLGRADAGRSSDQYLPIDLSGNRPSSEVARAFKRAG